MSRFWTPADLWPVFPFYKQLYSLSSFVICVVAEGLKSFVKEQSLRSSPTPSNGTYVLRQDDFLYRYWFVLKMPAMLAILGVDM